MGFNTKALLAFAVAMMMAITAVPVISADSATADLTALDGDLPSISITDRGNGVYTVDNPYLEDFFGISPRPSDMADPLGGKLEIAPQEIQYTTEGGWAISDVYDGELQSYQFHSSTYEDRQMVTFGAALSRAHTDEYHSDRDWTVNLHFSYNNTPGGHENLNISVSNSEVDVPVTPSWNVEPIASYQGSDTHEITSDQAINVLQYAVGDYDGDGNEEIALHYVHSVSIIGMEEDGWMMQEEYRYYLYDIPGKVNTLYTPVSMTSIDWDRDGVDELAVARSYYDNGRAGDNEVTVLFLIDPEEDTCSSWEITAAEVDGSRLDAVMVSVADSDVDGDGMPEIVVGGYLWNNARTDTGYTENWSYRGGELFLSYVEPEELIVGDVQLHALTVLGDDNGTATNWFGSSSHHSYNDHNGVDTSIYTTDNSANPTGLCRSPNWSNWTIPVEGVKLALTGGTDEQVFFNTWFYALEGERFVVYQKADFFAQTPDNNNVACNYIGAEVIWDQDPEDYDGTESLFISYACDLDSHYSGGDQEWCFVIYDEGDGGTASRTMGYDLFPESRVITEYGLLENMRNNHPLDYDDDRYSAELISRLYTYTDPTVVAVVSAVPYDQDLVSVLINGPDSIGSTEFERYTETGTSTEVSADLSVGPSGDLDVLFIKLAMDGGFGESVVESRTQTIEFSTGYESAEDAVAMYVIPVDIYAYRVTEYDENGGVRETVQTINYYHPVVNLMVGYENYVEFMEGYNRAMSDCFVGFNEVQVVDPFGHTQGDVSSFTEVPSNPLAEVSVAYYGAGTHTSVSQGIDLSTESESTVTESEALNINLQLGTHFLSTGVSIEMATENAWITSDASGLAFTSELSNGMEPDYTGYREDAHEVLSQYSMVGTFWAEMRASAGPDGAEASYVYVGYTVDRYTTTAAMASLEPDVYIPDGSDEDDPYNPTGDTLYLFADVPDTSSRPDRTADSYTLQIFWQGYWYDVNSTTLGFRSYIQDGSGWAETDTIVPGEEASEHVFMVTGLDTVPYHSFEFRLVAESNGYDNPSMAVTAYVDVRVLADSFRVVEDFTLSDMGVVINGSYLTGQGTIALFVNVGSSIVDPVSLHAALEDGTLVELAKDLSVSHDGYLICLIEALGDSDADDTGAQSSVWVLVVGVVVAMFVVGLVTRTED